MNEETRALIYSFSTVIVIGVIFIFIILLSSCTSSVIVNEIEGEATISQSPTQTPTVNPTIEIPLK